LTNCNCFAKIIIELFRGNLIHFIGSRAYPRLDHEKIKIYIEITADNGACGGDFVRTSPGIENKSYTIDVEIVVKKLREQAGFTK
jgi:hypothetical protein